MNYNTTVETGRNRNVMVDDRRTSILTGTVTEIANKAIGRMPRTAKLLSFNPQRHANRATNTLQAHGTTTHELMKNTAGQCQPQGSHSRMAVANTTERTKPLTNVNRWPRQ